MTKASIRCVALLALLAWSAWPGAVSAESLYNEQTFRPLAGDNKAYRVGDTLTVMIYEQSSGTTTTDTNTNRTNNLNAGVTTFSAKQFNGSAAVSGTFDGGGTTQRTNKLLDTLTVTVREILPSGDLKVTGEQLLTINGEQHKASLEGRVRLVDIAGDNSVQSTRIADVRINYTGDGDLSERQKRSWWRQLLDGFGL